ncbi:MAG: phosphodiester glycosidase family protein [Pseudomonadota bacterium]
MQPYEYQKIKKDNHVIHIVEIDPAAYNIQIARANDGSGRESIPALAQRVKADIAINGGFFEIGGITDGNPSNTLVIDGKIYALKDEIQSLLIVDKGTLSIKRNNPKNIKLNGVSILSGIPILISNGEIPADLKDKKTDFFVKEHARTAIGLKPNGNIILMIVEQTYSRDLSEVILGEVYSLINLNKQAYKQKYNKDPSDLTLREVTEIIEQKYSTPDGSKGVTILALASLMKELGCIRAINLDGGGSSTLWMNGAVMNKTVGDEDESKGESVIRKVSDAITFTKIK